MMLSQAPGPALPFESVPPRDKLPTLPFELEPYARWSCLPDADDELVFTAGPTLLELTHRVPRVVAQPSPVRDLSPTEAFLLSLVDGVSPVDLLASVAGVDPVEARVVLCDLYARGLVAFD